MRALYSESCHDTILFKFYYDGSHAVSSVMSRVNEVFFNRHIYIRHICDAICGPYIASHVTIRVMSSLITI